MNVVAVSRLIQNMTSSIDIDVNAHQISALLYNNHKDHPVGMILMQIVDNFN